MTTAMTNNGNVLATFIAELTLENRAAHDIEDPTARQQSISESTKDMDSVTIKPKYRAAVV